MVDKTIEREPGKLSLSKGKLGLSKGADSGKIRQSFSHGRSKTVTVEVKRKRAAGDTGGRGSRGQSTGGLSEEERAARIRANARCVRPKKLRQSMLPKRMPAVVPNPSRRTKLRLKPPTLRRQRPKPILPNLSRLKRNPTPSLPRLKPSPSRQRQNR